jgi:hypothetical protein
MVLPEMKLISKSHDGINAIATAPELIDGNIEVFKTSKRRKGKMVEWMQGSQLSQCSIIRKFFLSGTKICQQRKQPWAVPCPFLGAPSQAADCRIDKKTPVNACAKDIIVRRNRKRTTTRAQFLKGGSVQIFVLLPS